MSPRVRLLVADLGPTRVGTRIALEAEVEVCAEAGTGEEAVLAASRAQPDVCLLGRALAGDHLEVVGAIASESPRTAIVVLADRGDAEDMLASVRAGASGYLPGPVSAGGLRRLVSAAASGEAVIPRALVGELMLELRGAGSSLSAREAQVVHLLRRGYTTTAIADRLGIAPVTVRRHISDASKKLGVAGRAGLVSAQA